MQLDWPQWQKNNREFIASLLVIFTPSCFLRGAWIPVPHPKSCWRGAEHSQFLGWGSALAEWIPAGKSPRPLPKAGDETWACLRPLSPSSCGCSELLEQHPAPLAPAPNHTEQNAPGCSSLGATSPSPAPKPPSVPAPRCCTWAKPLRRQRCPRADFCPLKSLLPGQEKGAKSIFRQKVVGDPQLLVPLAEGKG